MEISINPYKTLTELEKYVDFKFKPNQRLIISQTDTLFFIKRAPYSIAFYNLFLIISHLGLPTEHILILTNQDIEEEIKVLSNIFDLTPMKIFVSYYNTAQTIPAKDVSNITLSPNLIDYPYISLNGLQRSSRVLLLCALQQRDVIDKGLVTWNFSKKSATATSDIVVNKDKTLLPFLVSNSLINDRLLLNQKYKEIFNIFSKRFINSDQSNPLITSFDEIRGGGRIFQAKFIQHALVYLVTETVADYPYPFLSEKTFKGFLV